VRVSLRRCHHTSAADFTDDTAKTGYAVSSA
jgi:hypothetical protein